MSSKECNAVLLSSTQLPDLRKLSTQIPQQHVVGTLPAIDGRRQRKRIKGRWNVNVVLAAFSVAIISFSIYTFTVTSLVAPPPLKVDVLRKQPEHAETLARRKVEEKDFLAAKRDGECPFRDSPIYRKVYVYPNPNEKENGWSGSMLSKAGRDLESLTPWPWLEIDQRSRWNATAHYDIESQWVQYSTELLVREVITNPKSCLRTYDPEKAHLFYVPYLPSVEHHMGYNGPPDMSASPWGAAIMDILDRGDYDAWEQLFGLTSKYWKRRDGSDHILVFSEPMHGLYHPRSKRGNFHYINTQKQLKPPIIISIELSRTFVEMYPRCTAKNILMPYPNGDGRWFNGKFDADALQLLNEGNISTLYSEAALPVERQLAKLSDTSARPVSQFYAAGNHGTCKQLRKSMSADYYRCAPSSLAFKKELSSARSAQMRLSTFCPCPGGDSPSAKRMFDSILAGCIPIVLSHDYVWPFTKEFDSSIPLNPADFSFRLSAKEFREPNLHPKTCLPLNTTRPGLQSRLESIPLKEIQRLRAGLKKARDLYSWYRRSKSLPDNPLRERVLPDGGAAYWLVQALAERAFGVRWPACEEELKQPRGLDPKKFKC